MKKYLVANHLGAYGPPLDEKEILRLLQTGALQPWQNCWCEGMPAWTPLHQMDFVRFAGQQPTASPIGGKPQGRFAKYIVPGVMLLLLSAGGMGGIALWNHYTHTPRYAQKQLLESGAIADVNELEGINGTQALYRCAESGDVENLILYLQAGADPNIELKDKVFRYPLFAACMRRDFACAEVLLQMGADPNIEYENDEGEYVTLLMQACIDNDEECALLLLKNGAMPVSVAHTNLREESVNDPYECCCDYRREGCLKLLLTYKEGHKPSCRSDKWVCRAISGASLSFVKIMIDGGVDVHDGLLYTSDYDKAKILIAAGADVNATNDDSARTPLSSACACSNLETVQLLLKHGAVVKKNSALLEEIGSKKDSYPGDDAKIAKLLVQHGADVNAGTPIAKNPIPLITAAENRRPELLKFWLEQGANIDARDSHGNTALLCLLRKSDTYTGYEFDRGKTRLNACVKVLVDAGADLSLRNNDGRDAAYYVRACHYHEAESMIPIHENRSHPVESYPEKYALGVGKSPSLNQYAETSTRKEQNDDVVSILNQMGPKVRAALFAAYLNETMHFMSVDSSGGIRNDANFIALDGKSHNWSTYRTIKKVSKHDWKTAWMGIHGTEKNRIMSAFKSEIESLRKNNNQAGAKKKA